MSVGKRKSWGRRIRHGLFARQDGEEGIGLVGHRSGDSLRSSRPLVGLSPVASASSVTSAPSQLACTPEQQHTLGVATDFFCLRSNWPIFRLLTPISPRRPTSLPRIPHSMLIRETTQNLAVHDATFAQVDARARSSPTSAADAQANLLCAQEAVRDHDCRVREKDRLARAAASKVQDKVKVVRARQAAAWRLTGSWSGRCPRPAKLLRSTRCASPMLAAPRASHVDDFRIALLSPVFPLPQRLLASPVMSPVRGPLNVVVMRRAIPLLLPLSFPPTCRPAASTPRLHDPPAHGAQRAAAANLKYPPGNFRRAPRLHDSRHRATF